MNVYQNAQTPGAPGTGGQSVDTTNLGYAGPAGQSKWGDSSPQNSGGLNYGGGQNPVNRSMSSYLPGGALPGSPGAFGGPSSLSGINLGQTGLTGNPAIDSLINSQLAQNNQARQQNQASVTGAQNYLKQFATPFTPDVIAAMKNQTAMKLQGAENNAFTQQQGILNADGQGDASSLAAAQAEASRNAMGAQAGADQNLGIQAALGNNAAGLTVGGDILKNLPQYHADNLGGLMGVVGSQNAQNLYQNTLANQQNAPINPGATVRTNGPVGAGDMSNAGPNGMNAGGGAGFNFGQPQAPSRPSMPPSGIQPVRQEGNDPWNAFS